MIVLSMLALVVFNRSFMLSEDSFGHSVHVCPAASTEEIGSLLGDLRVHGTYSYAGTEAARRLKRLGLPIIPVISRLLQQGCGNLDMIWLLKEFSLDDAIEPLSQALHYKADGSVRHSRWTDMYVRMAAASILGESHNSKAVPYLIDYFDRFRNAGVPTGPPHADHTGDLLSAVEALIKIGDGRVVEKCLGELQHPEPIIRLLCAQFLASRGRPECVPVLIALLNDQTRISAQRYVSREASHALQVITKQAFGCRGVDQWRQWWEGNQNQSPERWAQASFESAVRDLSSNDSDAVSSAILRLILSGTPKASKALLDFVFDDSKDLRLRSSVVYNLLGSNQVGIVVQCLRHPNTEIRTAAAFVIATPWGGIYQFRSKEAVSGLVKALRDEATLHNVIKALGLQKDPLAIPALLPFLNHSDPEVREDTIETLGMIGDKSVTPLLLSMLETPSPIDTVQIIKALGRLRDPRAFPFLLKILRHADRKTQMPAEEALNSVADTRFELSAPGCKNWDKQILFIESWWRQNREQILQDKATMR